MVNNLDVEPQDEIKDQVAKEDQNDDKRKIDQIGHDDEQQPTPIVDDAISPLPPSTPSLPSRPTRPPRQSIAPEEEPIVTTNTTPRLPSGHLPPPPPRTPQQGPASIPSTPLSDAPLSTPSPQQQRLPPPPI